MECQEGEMGEVFILTPLGRRIDASVGDDFRQKMSEIIANGYRTIVLDFSTIEFIDSSGLGAIVSGLRKLVRTGWMQ